MSAAERTFRNRFGRSPDVIVSAPGRVNLIGEHTDYSLLPAMPLAIDRRVVVAAGADDHRFEVHSGTYPEHPVMGRPGAEGWDRYIGAAVEIVGYRRGLVATVETDLPDTGGLASSSALTMALIAAMAAIDERRLSLDDIAEAAQRAERSVGVESGAMDQTVIAHGRAGSVLRLDFFPGGLPVRTEIPIPAAMGIVVGYSGEPAHKSGEARSPYNRSVVACRAATLLIADEAGLAVSLRPVLADVAGFDGALEATTTLPIHATAMAVAESLGVDVDRIISLERSAFDPNQDLPVRSSARHVLTEARRVDETHDALVAGEIELVGQLMDESHRSLAKFGASTSGLDRLTLSMRRAGAWGARLTGAGFGGNAVAICDPERLEAVIAASINATGGPAFHVTADDGMSYQGWSGSSGCH